MLKKQEFVQSGLGACSVVHNDSKDITCDYRQSAFISDMLGIIHDNWHQVTLGMTDGRYVKLDSATAVFFARQLEAVESRFYDVKYPELKNRKHIPISTEGPAGAETITYYMWNKFGMASILRNGASDLRRSDVNAKRYTAPVIQVGEFIEFTTRELRSAAMAGVPLESWKQEAQARAHAQRENQLGWSGSSADGVYGFITNPNLPSQQAALGASLVRTWIDTNGNPTKTPQEILDDISTGINGIRSATKYIWEADTILLPPKQYAHISTHRYDNTSPLQTIIDWLMANVKGYGITTIDVLPNDVYELEGTGPGGTDQMLIYKKDPAVVQQRIPLPMTMGQPVFDMLSVKLPSEAEHAGTVVRYPLACRLVYGI